MYRSGLLRAIHLLCNRFLFLTLILLSISVHACEPPTIIFPAQHADMFSGRPVISWLPVNDASGYEITIQSRIPEGEVIAQLSTTTTDTKFIPATALARERAIVSVKVSARCSSAGVSPESERIFFVDVQSTCPLPARLSSTPVGEFIKISWEANALFQQVEVRSFGVASTGPIERVSPIQNFALVPMSKDLESIIGVRGICQEADGDWAWLIRNK